MQAAIIFSSDNVESLSTLVDEISDTLTKSGFELYNDHLMYIVQSAESGNSEKFKNLVIDPILFGGAGALWEIWIEDRELKQKFNQQFCRLVDHLRKMGIRNSRIDQVRRGFTL